MKPENIEVKTYYHLFKFSSKDKLEKLQKSGKIYMKNLDFFKKLEEKTRVKGQGDKNEARLFSSNNAEIYTLNSNILIGTAKMATVYDTKNLKNPVFCSTIKNLIENVKKVEGEKFEAYVQFDSKLFKDFEKDENELYVLIIKDVYEFLSRIKAKLSELNINIYHNFVKYRDTSHIYQNQDTIKFNGPFHKDTYFEHQEEFRILVDTEVEDYLEIEIGSIEDISMLIKAEEIKNGIIVRNYIESVEAIGDSIK